MRTTITVLLSTGQRIPIEDVIPDHVTDEVAGQMLREAHFSVALRRNAELSGFYLGSEIAEEVLYVR